MTTNNPSVHQSVVEIAQRMVLLTQGNLPRVEIRGNHLRLITGGEPDGIRLGRDFGTYQRFADTKTPTMAITDFAGVLLRFMELWPTHFDMLRPYVLDLGKLMYPDENIKWQKVWTTPEESQ